MRQNPIRRRFFIVLRWLIYLVLLMQLWFFGWIMWWNHRPPHRTAFMTTAVASITQPTSPKEAAKNKNNNDKATEKAPHKSNALALHYQWVDNSRISPNIKRAVIAAEDGQFMNHYGFDWSGIKLAITKNLKKRRLVAGGSTISQQLAKNLFLSKERSLIRKAQEAVITLMIETLWTKERILEVYLNVVEWGDLVYGIEAASQHYYGIPAQALNATQAAQLAAILPNPKRYDRIGMPPPFSQKAQRILDNMEGVVIPH